MATQAAEARRTRLSELAERLAQARARGAEEGREIFVLVEIQDKRFLLHARDVAEIVRPVRLSPAFAAPEHILGVAAVHGRPWSILELGRFLPLPITREDTPRTRWVLLRHPHMHVGFRVDAVLGMRFAREEELEAPEDAALWSGVLAEADARLPVLKAEAVFG